MTKKVLYFSSFAFLVLFALVVANAGPVQAEEALSVPYAPDTSLAAPSEEVVNPLIRSSKNLTFLQNRGVNLIKARTNSLSVLKTKIQKTKLTDTQKSSLVATIDGRITSLNALAEQLPQTKTVEEARKLVESIYSGYRIYAIVIPQIDRMMKFDELTNYVTKLNLVTFAEVQKRIDADKARGKEVTNWQNNLNAAKDMVPMIQTKIDMLRAKVAGLQPADYPTSSKTIFADIKTGIASVRQDISTLRQKLVRVK